MDLMTVWLPDPSARINRNLRLDFSSSLLIFRPCALNAYMRVLQYKFIYNRAISLSIDDDEYYSRATLTKCKRREDSALSRKCNRPNGRQT